MKQADFVLPISLSLSLYRTRTRTHSIIKGTNARTQQYKQYTCCISMRRLSISNENFDNVGAIKAELVYIDLSKYK